MVWSVLPSAMGKEGNNGKRFSAYGLRHVRKRKYKSRNTLKIKSISAEKIL